MAVVKLALAFAQLWTILFAVVVIAALNTPLPGLVPDDRLIPVIPGVALLAVGWVWLLRIRRGIDRQ